MGQGLGSLVFQNGKPNGGDLTRVSEKLSNPCDAEPRGEDKLPGERAQHLPPLLRPVRHADVHQTVESAGPKQSLEIMIRCHKSASFLVTLMYRNVQKNGPRLHEICTEMANKYVYGT